MSLKGNKLKINQQSADVIFSTNAATNEVSLRANHLTASFTSKDFHFQEWIFIATGSATVSLNDIDIGFGMTFKTQTLADGTVMPLFGSADVVVNIDRSNIDIDLSGNIWTDLVSLFEVFIKGPVADELQSVLSKVLTGLPGMASDALAATDGRAPMPGFPTWVMDFSTPDAAIITDTTFEFGIRGIMYDTEIGESEMSMDFPAMPYKNTNHTAQLQIFLSTLSIESVAKSGLEVGDASGWINSTMVVNGTSLDITCGLINHVFSGLSDKYGADTPANLFFNLTSLHNIHTSEETQILSFDGSFDFAVWVPTDAGDVNAVEVGFDDVSFEASVTITNFTIGIDIKKFTVHAINTLVSTIGNLHTLTLKTLINSAMLLLLPALNAIIAKIHLQFPDNILGLFALSDLYLEYFTDYFYFGVTPTFLNPFEGAAQQEVQVMF